MLRQSPRLASVAVSFCLSFVRRNRTELTPLVGRPTVFVCGPGLRAVGQMEFCDISYGPCSFRQMALLADAVSLAEASEHFAIQFLARIEAEGMDVISR